MTMTWCPFCGIGQIEFTDGCPTGSPPEIWQCNNCEMSFVECAECEGMGYIVTRWDHIEEREAETTDCPECHGLGLIEEA